LSTWIGLMFYGRDLVRCEKYFKGDITKQAMQVDTQLATSLDLIWVDYSII